MRLHHLLLALCVAAPCVHAAIDESAYDSRTIRGADRPANAPRFSQYPAGPVFKGRLARPDVRSDPRARAFRTRITQDAAAGPNFAGHYTVVRWGCGTGCLGLAIVDVQSGKVHFPPNLRSLDNNNVAYEELEGPDGPFTEFLPTSRLMVVAGGINENPKLRGISYFVWENDRLRRIRFVAKP
ncbi:MAG: hypothetical protein EOO26_00625 [Comamonadaceae bacterium]|nr:MAG: hypothetical protein EOO26_00625 [Comamonadaceae bacterium]